MVRDNERCDVSKAINKVAKLGSNEASSDSVTKSKVHMVCALLSLLFRRIRLPRGTLLPKQLEEGERQSPPHARQRPHRPPFTYSVGRIMIFEHHLGRQPAASPSTSTALTFSGDLA